MGAASRDGEKTPLIKRALAGAIALLIVGSTSLSAQPLLTDGAGLMVTHTHIAQLKSILQLTPEQERHWPSVEAALRGLVKVQDVDAPHHLTQTVRAPAAAITANAARIARVLVAAKPLIKSLNEEQRREAMALVRSLGIGTFAAAL